MDAEEEDFPEPEPAAEEAPDSPEAKRKAELLKTVEALDKKLQTIEYKLVSPALVNSDDKYFVEPYRAYLNLIWLNAEVGTGGGDMAGGADFPPTDTELDTLRTIETEMTEATSEFQKLLKDDLPAFNRVLGNNNVAVVVAAGAAEPDQRGGELNDGRKRSEDARKRDYLMRATRETCCSLHDSTLSPRSRESHGLSSIRSSRPRNRARPQTVRAILWILSRPGCHRRSGPGPGPLTAGSP